MINQNVFKLNKYSIFNFNFRNNVRYTSDPNPPKTKFYRKNIQKKNIPRDNTETIKHEVEAGNLHVRKNLYYMFMTGVGLKNIFAPWLGKKGRTISSR